MRPPDKEKKPVPCFTGPTVSAGMCYLCDSLAPTCVHVRPGFNPDGFMAPEECFVPFHPSGDDAFWAQTTKDLENEASVSDVSAAPAASRSRAKPLNRAVLTGRPAPRSKFRPGTVHSSALAMNSRTERAPCDQVSQQRKL